MNALRLSPLLLLAACSVPLGLDGHPCPCATGWTCCPGAQICVEEASTCPGGPGDLGSDLPDVAVTLMPTPVSVPAGQVQSFVANQPVTWRVDESGGGTIDANGLYTAPATPGSYTVIATSIAHPERFEVAQVTVVAWQLDRVSGALGGRGDRDDDQAGSRFANPQQIVAAGNRFLVADCDNNTIRQFSASGWATIAGTPPDHPGPQGASSVGFADGIGAAARFQCPVGLAYDSGAGVVYIGDRYNGLIRKLDLATLAVTTIAGKPGINVDQDGVGTAAHFEEPSWLTLDGQGHLYVSEPSQIRRVDLSSLAVTTLPTVGTAPAGVTFDPTGGTSGLLYVADMTDVRSFDPSSSQVSSVASGFTRASDVALDGAGNLLVTDSGDAKVLSIDLATAAVTDALTNPAGALGTYPNGIFVLPAAGGAPETVFVSDVSGIVQGIAFLPSSPPGTITQLVSSYGGTPYTPFTPSTPQGVASDDAGHLWSLGAIGAFFTLTQPAALAVSRDGGSLYFTQGNAVYSSSVSYSASGTAALSMPARLAGDPTAAGYLDATGAAARFNQPSALALDDKGSVYVAEANNYTVRRIDLATGAVSTLAGDPHTSGSQDGVGTQALFAGPAAMAFVSSVGLLYVADYDTLRTIDPATGVVKTTLGAAGVHETVDGVGTAARFVDPVELTYDRPRDLLYVVEADYVRRLDVHSSTVKTLVGSGYSGVALGALPGSLNHPSYVAVMANGELQIGNCDETAVVSVHAPTH